MKKNTKILLSFLAIIAVTLVVAYEFVDLGADGATWNARSRKDTSKCQSDAGCPELESCVEGKCVVTGQQDEGESCNDDEDCGLGLECNGGMCAPEQGTGQEGAGCTSGIDCSIGLMCVDGTCTGVEE